MTRLQRGCAKLVFLFSAGAYLPLAVGGWQHPIEVNIASYGIWLIISGFLLYSSCKQGFSGWLLPLGFFIGNSAMLVLGFSRGGYTFNLGPAETVALYGVVGTLCVWMVMGQATGKWNPRILFLGGVAADVLSFYPQLKQYLLPHDPPTHWMIAGWCSWIMAAAINIAFVEKLFTKLRMSEVDYQQHHEKDKNRLLILEESAFSIENCAFMIVTVFVMTR